MQPTQYIRKSGIAVRGVADTRLLIPLKGNVDSVYTLNKSGCLLWDALEKPLGEKQLAGLLKLQFAISEGDAVRDVAAFLADMQRLELVVKLA